MIRQSLLKKIKQNLNEQVARLNEDVLKLRENEIQIKNKEKALKKLREALKSAVDPEDFGRPFFFFEKMS